MARDSLTGTRIRDRRVVLDLKQSELARRIGISAPYLNLIEHNKRRIGGKLLLDIASALDVEPQALTEGAETTLIAALREAAEAAGLAHDEALRVEEFVGRFPGWAQVLADAQTRLSALERKVETLSDRMTHDPHLAASLHEVLTTTAAIRSTASILAETGDLAPALQSRFHANMHQDSERLSESARILVRFLDADLSDSGAMATAQDEVDAWLAACDFHFPELEAGRAGVDEIVAGAGLGSDAARRRAARIVQEVARDAERLALGRLQEAVAELGVAPLTLAQRFGVDLSLLMRRLASLPEAGVGLVVIDQAGAQLFRKPVEGFDMPRYAAGCVMWPVFRTLTQPGVVIREPLAPHARPQLCFDAYAVAETRAPSDYNAPAQWRASMLLVARDAEPAPPAQSVRRVGATCRICPARGCPGRRESSILSEAPDPDAVNL